MLNIFKSAKYLKWFSDFRKSRLVNNKPENNKNDRIFGKNKPFSLLMAFDIRTII